MSRRQRLAPDTLRLERYLDAPPEAVRKLQILRIEPPRLLEFTWGRDLGWNCHHRAGGVVREFWALHLQAIAEVKAQLGG